MKLAKYKIINIDSILVASRINRIADKEVKDALLKEYLEIHKIAEAAKADQNEISRKFNADWREEATAVAKYRNAGKPGAAAPEIAAGLRKLNEETGRLQS